MTDDELQALLQQHGIRATAVERFSGGASNLTYLVRTDDGEVVARIPPPGAKHIKAGHDMAREGRFLQKLHPHYPLAPRPILVVDEPPLFVMEKKQGRILRKRKLDLAADEMRALCERFVDGLAALHAIDVHATGLVSLGKPDGYVQRQVDGWRQRYDNARTDEISDMDRLSKWLSEHVPPSARVAVTHNDYKYDNVVFDDAGHLCGVLDWELAAIGDPLTDLGTVLAYWIEATDDAALMMLPLGPTTVPGNLTRSQIVARYEEKTGHAVEHLLFHVVLASFRIAVIAQQIYFRYARGFTQDERFASMGFAVALVAARACRFLDAGRIDVA
jgi:aminoglycoside phosphotransferase (APT) family kinase protein